MTFVRSEFLNELGHKIALTINHDERGVTVSASGPTSQVEHTWTPLEARELRRLLQLIEPAYKRER